jgi:hypothetical protein
MEGPIRWMRPVAAARDLIASRRNLLVLAFAIVAIIDRIHWAMVAQWREDQATTLWIGLHAFQTGLPVGLISSTQLLNPNGMPLLAALLARLPNLLVVSAFLGCLQAAALAAFCRAALGAGGRFWVVFLPLSTAVVLRGTANDFVNQWTLPTIVLFLAAVAVAFARRPRGWHVPVATALLLFCPALYLLGIINAILFCAIGLCLLAVKAHRAAQDGQIAWRRIGKGVAWVVVVAFASTLATWRPFFQHVSWAEMRSASPTPLNRRFAELWSAVVHLPDWIGDWASAAHAFAPSLFNDQRILSPGTVRIGRFAMRLIQVQAGVAVVAAAAGLARAAGRWIRRIASARPGAANERLMRTHSVAPMSIAVTLWLGPCLLSPLIVKQPWHRGRRLDQAVMCAPFFLFAIFAAPFSFSSWPRVERALRATTAVLAIAVSVTSALAGVLAVRNHLDYRGSVLSEADVPLIDKQHAVSFIAADWRASAGDGRGEIPVDYDLAGRWPLVPAFGARLNQYYPAPMTTGRSFDFELERRFGLRNAQEGIQRRQVGSGRYVISYAFRPVPAGLAADTTHHVFGRLRVSVAPAKEGAAGR